MAAVTARVAPAFHCANITSCTRSNRSKPMRSFRPVNRARRSCPFVSTRKWQEQHGNTGKSLGASGACHCDRLVGLATRGPCYSVLLARASRQRWRGLIIHSGHWAIPTCTVPLSPEFYGCAIAVIVHTGRVVRSAHAMPCQSWCALLIPSTFFLPLSPPPPWWSDRRPLTTKNTRSQPQATYSHALFPLLFPRPDTTQHPVPAACD